MPTATAFTALGAGNGFPKCLSKRDVSIYDYWITLGGFKKGDSGSPTTQQVNNSYNTALKLYWNFNGFEVDFNDSGTITTESLDINQGDFNRGHTATPFEPKDRICRQNLIYKYGFYPEGVEFPDFDWTFGETLISTRINPVRMYDGSTSNENNFIGYGIDSTYGLNEFSYPFIATSGSVYFVFASFLEETNDPSFDDITAEYSDAIESGLWLVAASENNATINGLTSTISNFSVTFKNFDFYTY
tara:strand:- start:425 stop:1159 length:735 start_codon:yes stop_codon:yes gene_type:complete